MANSFWSDISLNIFDNEIAFISRYCEKRLFQKHVIIDHLGFISLINRFHQAINQELANMIFALWFVAEHKGL